MLFNLPALAAAAAFIGLATSSPILENELGSAMVKRAPQGGRNETSHGGGSGGSSGGSSSSDGGSHGGGSSNGTSGGGSGPSGQLIQPVGDQYVFTEVAWPGAGFRFVYKPVYQKNPDPNCVNQRQACYAETRWLQVSLVSTSDSSRVYSLANYLHNDLDNPSANIDTWLGVPVEAVCGDYRVRVIENQRYFNRWVSFQSAAPLIHTQCVRYSGPGE